MQRTQNGLAAQDCQSHSESESTMSEPQKPNSGFLMKNKKQRDDSDPGYQGSINVDGKDFWLSEWLNTSKAGEKYFSVRVNPKKADPGAPPKSEPTSQSVDEDVPF